MDRKFLIHEVGHILIGRGLKLETNSQGDDLMFTTNVHGGAITPLNLVIFTMAGALAEIGSTIDADTLEGFTEALKEQVQDVSVLHTEYCTV